MSSRHLDWSSVLGALESGGSFSPAEAEHLDDCGACRELRSSAQELLQALRVFPLPRVPDELVESTTARLAGAEDEAFQSTAPGAEVPQQPTDFDAWLRLLRDRLTQLEPVLLGDSLQASPAVRGGQVAQSPTLLYDAGSIRLSLRVSQVRGGDRELRGQVIPTSGQNLPAQARAFVFAGSQLAEQKLAVTGEFTLRGLPPGTLNLVLLLEHEFLTLPLEAQ